MTRRPRSPDELFRQVERLLPQPPGEPLGPTTRLRDDLGLDSLDSVELYAALEEAYGIELPDAARDTIDTLSDLAAQLGV